MSETPENPAEAQQEGSVPKAVVSRLSLYLRELQHLIRDGFETTSSTQLGKMLGFTKEQIQPGWREVGDAYVSCLPIGDQGVEGREHLVANDDVGIGGEGARQGNPLALAARKLGRIAQGIAGGQAFE